jgi:hypothetical protein
MKEFVLKHGSAGTWITDDLFLVSPLPLENIDLTNKKDVRERLLTLAKAKFKYKKNISIKDEPSEIGITAIVCISDNCKLKMLGGIHTLEKRFTVMFIGNEEYSFIDGDFLVETFKYEYGTDSFGTGSKKYIVTSTVRDVYQLPIYAESEEDALKKSKDYHINDWHHLEDTDEHLKDVVFVRAAKWGNFEVKEIL